MQRIAIALGKLDWGKRACAAFVLCVTTAIALPAQTFTSLDSFNGANGNQPYASLVQTTNGDLYGTTFLGGANGNYGTVFKMPPSGTLTTIYSFCSQSGCTDGYQPVGGLIQAANGNLYGTTEYGGANSPEDCPSGACGTVFEVTPSGTLTTLYSFCSQPGCTDGATPVAGLIQATNGNLYGTTEFGGANGVGTVFQITPNGTLRTIYSFCSQSGCTDGYQPTAGLVQATNGDFYGTTQFGGAYGLYDGTVFKITPGGTLTTLHSFCSQPACADGYEPFFGSLIQGSNGDLYGTTHFDGTGTYGTVFKMTPSGTLTTIHSFCSQPGCTDGAQPYGGLAQATDGNFYGTTYYGGSNPNCSATGAGCGTLFKMTPSGTLTTLHSFDYSDGSQPIGALVQDTNGLLYGSTELGGALNCTPANLSCGTVFSLAVGLGPFVETQTTSGKVGAAVKILGNNLTHASSVTFNGTLAVFTASASEIKTTVPTGATTGPVRVVTPSGTLSSNVPFRVLP
jgi:uncharacterized repeat protein (TIGR03803 family)